MFVGGLLSSSNAITAFVLLQIVVFLYYDSVVQRQEKLSDRQACSERIIEEMFPEPVRRRLSEPKHCEDKATQPILDTYDEATVLFADIANFTKWSSGRDPRQVFELLERLYAKFDQLAVRHCVAKIETIGDCYMAVTGCPATDDKHALHMAEFADAMLQAANDILGVDSSSGLQLRIGIHSGPVVAGVLRNHKARYQLFGDTVNVAARMESNGVAGRIQISQATAECLRNMGKAHWLQRRQDAVFAKGKGIVFTYWLDRSKESSLKRAEESTFFKHEQVILVAPTPLKAKSSSKLPRRSPIMPARNLFLTKGVVSRSFSSVLTSA